MELVTKLRVGFRKISSKRPLPPNVCFWTRLLPDAVYTLECTHRRQLFPARALNARSSSIRALFCPLTKTIGDVRIDDLAIRSALQLSTVRVESLSIEVQRPAALYDFFVFAVGVKGGHLSSLFEPPLCLRSGDRGPA